ncbi:MAG: hypothetical protein WB998_02835 [Solirubrobacteraceae bacterium]
MSEVTSVNGQTGAVVLTAADVEAVPTSAEGQPEGVATLDGSGLLSAAQVPSSVERGSAEGTTKMGLVPQSQGSGNTNAYVPQQINVRAFGASPGTNCTAAVEAAITQAKGEGLKNIWLYFPAAASAYKLALGTLGKEKKEEGVSVKITGDGHSASRIAPVSATEPILTVAGPQDSSNDGFTMEDIGLELQEDRRYDRPLIQLNFAKNWCIDRVGLWANNHTGTFFGAESSYEFHWRLVRGFGWAYAIPLIHTNEREYPESGGPLAQADNFLFERCTFNGPNGPIFRNALDEVHGVIGISLKVQASTYYPEGCKLVTTLTEEANAGATSCKLASVSELKVGQQLRIGHDANGNASDYVKITAIEGLEVKFSEKTPLLFKHASGAAAQMGGIGLSLGDNTHSCLLIQPHFERLNAAVAVGNTTGLKIVGYYGSTNSIVLLAGPSGGHHRVMGPDSVGGPLSNKIWEKSSDNTLTNMAELFSEPPYTTQIGAAFELNPEPPAAVQFMAAIVGAGGAYAMRRSVALHSGENTQYKAGAYEAAEGGTTTTAKITYGGRGYFKDSISIGDLGSITGKTSAEIDALLKLSPTDAASVGTLIATAEREAKKVVLTRKTGAGNKWQFAALTEIA